MTYEDMVRREIKRERALWRNPPQWLTGEAMIALALLAVFIMLCIFL